MSLFVQLDVEEIGHGLELVEAVEAARAEGRVIAEVSYLGILFRMSFSAGAPELLNPLISNAGRFCETGCADLLDRLQELDAFIRPTGQEISKENRWVLGFGIREGGIDNASRLVRLLGDGYSYRKILALDIQDVFEESVWQRKIALVDISRHVKYLQG